MQPLITYLVRASLRRRWRAALALALALGVVGGAVLAATAGARRTASAYPRMITATNAPDLLVSPAAEAGDLYERIEALDGVDGVGPLRGVPLAFAEGSAGAQIVEDAGLSLDFLNPQAAVDERLGRAVSRPLITAGRFPDPDEPREAFATRFFADTFGVRPGSVIEMQAYQAPDLGVPERVGQRFQLTITGIGVQVTEVVPFSDLDEVPVLLLTPAFLERLSPEFVNYEGAVVDLEPDADVGALASRVQGMEGADFVSDLTAAQEVAADSIRPVAVALALFAVVIAVTGLAAATVLVGRFAVVTIGDGETLAAVGLSGRQRVLASLAVASTVGVAAAVVSVLVAAACSGLFPIGPARLAEVDPGVRLDLPVLMLGFCAVAAAIPLMAVPSVGFAVRRRVSVPSRVVRVPGGVGPAASAGLAFVVGGDSGREARASVPVRSAVGGAALATGSVVAAVVFAASLTTLVDTPARWGQRWEHLVDSQFGPVPIGNAVDSLGRDERVEGIAYGSYGVLLVDGQSVPTISFGVAVEGVELTVVEGRSIASPDEILLGGATMDALGVAVGDRIAADPGSGEVDLEVVGRAVFPRFGLGSFQTLGLGVGAAVHPDVLPDAVAVYGEDPADLPLGYAIDGKSYNFAAIDLAEGAALSTGELLALGDGIAFQRTTQEPPRIEDLDRVRAVPTALAGVLSLLSVVTLAHLAISGVRARRRDLATLKAMGFDRRQMRSVVRTQASAVAAAGAVLGVPAGLVVGRMAWTAVVDALHLPPHPAVPLLAVAGVVVSALIIAVLVAAWPARRAARIPAAIALRAEAG